MTTITVIKTDTKIDAADTNLWLRDDSGAVRAVLSFVLVSEEDFTSWYRLGYEQIQVDYAGASFRIRVDAPIQYACKTDGEYLIEIDGYIQEPQP